MPEHATRQRRRWYQLLHTAHDACCIPCCCIPCWLLHTAHRMLAAYPAAAYPAAYPVSTLYTSAQPYYSATENCHFQMQIQLSRNFQNLHSNTLLVCYNDNISMKGLARMNIWSKKNLHFKRFSV